MCVYTHMQGFVLGFELNASAWYICICLEMRLQLHSVQHACSDAMQTISFMHMFNRKMHALQEVGALYSETMSNWT